MSGKALDPEKIPITLRNMDQWVCWRTENRDGKATKVPINPSTSRFASTTDPSTWCSFDRALHYTRDIPEMAGLGFVFTEDDPFVGVDLDACRDAKTGHPSALAEDIIDQLDSYTEVSPSETGYHVIVQAAFPKGRNRHGSVECYATSRYFTVTGDHVSETPKTIEERSEALTAVHTEYVAAKRHEGAAKPSRSPLTLNDEGLLQKATQAANGERFERLWNGSTVGYSSHSEADMALCCHLAFWTGGKPDQMDRLFRDSGLLREKWDEVHFADGSTYGEKTISRAVERVTKHYDPAGTPSEPGVESAETRTQHSETRLDGERTDVGAHNDNERLLTTIDRLDERIEALEAENERLRNQLNRVPSSSEPSVETPQVTTNGSLLSIVKRLFLRS